MTNKFHTEKDHGKAFALLFHTHNIEQKFKERVPDIQYTVVKDKEEARLGAMLHIAGEIGHKFIQLQTSAVMAVAIASSEEQHLLMQMGMVKIIPSGVAICPTCLARAILTCEENLEVLKDIQEATKRYAVE